MMNDHSVALILPCYGKLPNYFPLWLKSAGANRNFTFMIFSDEDFSCYGIPDNVHVHRMTLDEIRARIAPHLDFDFVLDRPYKLCDYKPLYGLIFQDYLEGYDFWGHCDPDVIWGDIGKYTTDEILNKYDKIYIHSHFLLYRNTEKSRTFILHKLPGWNISYRDVYKSSHSYCMDESPLNRALFSYFADGWGGYYLPDFADVAPQYKEFRIFKGQEVVSAFRWKDGKVFALTFKDDSIIEIECLYLHMQKRAMKFEAGLENEDSFMIIPNEFVKDYKLTIEEARALIQPDKEYERAFHAKYPNYGGVIHGKRLLSWRRYSEVVKNFLSLDKHGKIIFLKKFCNFILRRKLPDVIYNS